MRVWLITVGEPLPFDARAGRLLRAGILANMLAATGREVVWWTSTFDHVHKRHRFTRDTTQRLENGVIVRLLHGSGYRRNISLMRIAEHALVARRFALLAPTEVRPDVVLCSLPTLELAVSAVRYGRKHGVPVIIDIRDLWPDVFLELCPPWLRRGASIALSPMWLQARAACRGAYALTGNSPQFVEWGLNLARRSATGYDRHFPFGYDAESPAAADRDRALSFWRSLGIEENRAGAMGCFFGAFSGQFDFDTVLSAADLLEKRQENVRFILCGTGEQLAPLRHRARALRSVLFPGWIGSAEIWTLMRMSTFGLAPYCNELGFTGNMPNKPIEYLSAGLPVVSSLQGHLKAFLADQHCGITYPAGNAQALAAAISKLVHDPEATAGMSARAGAVFAERFDAKRVYGEMIDYLSEVSAAFRSEQLAA